MSRKKGKKYVKIHLDPDKILQNLNNETIPEEASKNKLKENQ